MRTLLILFTLILLGCDGEPTIQGKKTAHTYGINGGNSVFLGYRNPIFFKDGTNR